MKTQLTFTRSAGLSLVELLVAMAIGVFILGGVVKVMVDSKDAFLFEQEVAYLQENARFAVDELGYELRQAGYFGCNQQGSMTNTLNATDDDDDWMFQTNGIRGYESSAPNLPSEFSSILSGTDALIVNRGERDDSTQVSSHVPASATIHLNGSQPFNKGEVLVIANADCSHMAAFQMTGPNSNNPAHLNHSKSNSMVPGNCKKALSASSTGGNYSCGGPNEPANNVHGLEYGPGSAIMKFKSSGFFVANSDLNGMPTLFRVVLQSTSSSATTQAQAFLPGVEDMQVIYGVDTNATDSDCEIDRYYSADQITKSEADAASSWIGWNRVMAARVSLILRSKSEVYPSNTSVDLGGGFTYNDRYLRQRVTSTVALRNRTEACS
ncbi:PilW family protein [Agaribacterium haliotis]|uniref:PilW family protein n=1 Tax=Agaribacterium haliotis TaxID=2013869 RepID=UPI000BB57A3B|nr:PilW family protein [Agaribacterium haliotis]